MGGDFLDVVLLVVCAGFAVSGYRQGFVVGALALGGFLGGGAVGAQLAPAVARRLAPDPHPALVGLVCVFVLAIVGQLVATVVAAGLRRRLTWGPARVLDSAGGAAVSLVSVLLVAWFLATAVGHSTLTGVARQVRHSVVLAKVDEVMPDAAKTWFSSFRRLIDDYGFPQVFGGIGPDPVRPVAPPDPGVTADPDVLAAARSVVKIIGSARACSRQLEGSGFVFAPQHVITNAHVVAGVTAPEVLVPGGPVLAATVVRYDPDRDVAVLDVPGLTVRPLAFAAAPAVAGAPAVVAGYPQDGPFTAVAARVRAVQRIRGPDIYQRAEVRREIYALRALVRPGNSGGPLLAPDGRVYGVVFAAAVDDPTTGYALTYAEVAQDARLGAVASARVDTQGCD